MLGEAGDQWEEVTADDIWAFLGFSIMMGLNRVPALHQYWSCKDLYYNRAIASKISRDRFIAILRYIHFVANQPESTTTTCTSQSSPLPLDRLWKVRPVISAVLDACRGNYHPHREQAIDEAMVGFKGRSCMKQYLPKKPTKRGFKIWVRADSHNGYVCEFDCYTGKTGGVAEVGLGGSVVRRLTRDLVGKGYHIFMDSFFSSVNLYKELLIDNIYATGTLIFRRRNFPPDLALVAKRGLGRRGDMVVRQDGNVCVTVWQDTRPVTFMSSAHNPVDTTVVHRKKKDNSIVHLDCPVSIAGYNKYMGGVDKGDQLRKYYHVRNKSRKYYRYIFWFLFEVCVLNSFILSRYSPCNHPNKTYIAFRECLANELVGNYNSRKRQSYSSNHIYHTLICNIRHYPQKLSKGWCKYSSCSHQTLWYCPSCDKRLCHTGSPITDCFLKHHAEHKLF